MSVYVRGDPEWQTEFDAAVKRASWETPNLIWHTFLLGVFVIVLTIGAALAHAAWVWALTPVRCLL